MAIVDATRPAEPAASSPPRCRGRGTRRVALPPVGATATTAAREPARQKVGRAVAPLAAAASLFAAAASLFADAAAELQQRAVLSEARELRALAAGEPSTHRSQPRSDRGELRQRAAIAPPTAAGGDGRRHAAPRPRVHLSRGAAVGRRRVCDGLPLAGQHAARLCDPLHFHVGLHAAARRCGEAREGAGRRSSRLPGATHLGGDRRRLHWRLVSGRG